MPTNTASARRTRGFTLVEMTIALGIMAAIMALVLETMQLMASSSKAGLAQSDLTTRTTGTVYDIVSELRQATAQCPPFLHRSRSDNTAQHHV